MCTKRLKFEMNYMYLVRRLELMRKYKVNPNSISRTAMAVMALAGTAFGVVPVVKAQHNSPVPVPQSSSGVHQSVLKISEDSLLPAEKIVAIAMNKSLMIELPTGISLRDVIVSNPKMADAVLQSPNRDYKPKAGEGADKASNRIYIVGKKGGQTNVFFFDTSGKRILTLEVQIEIDTRPLDAMLGRFIPGSKIRTESLNDTLILTGTVRNPADSSSAVKLANRFARRGGTSAKVINMLVVEGEEQVTLRVKFAEVQRSVLKQFGINLGAAFNNENGIVTALTDNAFPTTATQGLTGGGRTGVEAVTGLATTVLPQIPTATGNVVGNSGIAGAFVSRDGARSLSYTLRALERGGLVRTLAEPNLTAISGESANFLAGGEFPIPVSTGDGEVDVTFKEYGVSLSFTPVVLSAGRISLKISTEVSELSTNGAVTYSNIAIPALTKRRTESTVELPSGGTLAMSGLVQNNIQRNIDGFPGLKELPVLGTLFRSTDFVNRETELVVMVTPYIVRPNAKSDLARPTDGLVPADDGEGILMGRLNKIYRRAASLPEASSKDIGFIID